MTERFRFRGTRAHDLLGDLCGSLDRENLMPAIARTACGEVPAEGTIVFLVDRIHGKLSGLVACGGELRPVELPLGRESIAGFCAVAARPIRIDDVSADLSTVEPGLAFCPVPAEALGLTTRSVLVVPVRFRDDVIGVLQALSTRPGAFTEEDCGRLEEFASLAGLALHACVQYEDVKGRRQIDQRKSEFMDLLVHEIKEPIAAIQMMAEYVTEIANDPAEKLRLVERIGQRSRQVTRLITELLEVSRVKRGLVLGEVRPVHLGEVARLAVQGLSDFAELRGVNVVTNVAADLPPVRLDDALAPYLVTNLVNNAIKYTDGGGTVRVSVSRESGGVLLEVIDTGIGVPPGEARRLFREFYRASNARGRGVDGTGLGLVAVKDIAERYGGRVGVESEVDKGSRFWAWLPACDPS